MKTFAVRMHFTTPHNLQPPPQPIRCELPILIPEGRPTTTTRLLGARQVDRVTWDVTFEYDAPEKDKP